MHNSIPNLNLRSNIYIYILVSLFLTLFITNTVFADNLTYYQAEVSPSLRLTIPSDEISITVDPSSKPFDYKDFTLVVDTNNPTGYNLSMSSSSTDLIKTTDNAKTIPTLTELAGGYTQDTFETNKWGYRIGSANYIPFVPEAKIAESNGPASGDSTTLRFATKVDFLQPAGEYKTTLNFIAVVNPVPVTYIQNLDPSLCTSSPLTVVDARDGEEYVIRRLADGRCWMLDNLRLDPTEVALGDLQGNTNAPDEALNYLKNGGGEDAYPADAVQVTTDYHSSWTEPFVVTQYKDTVIEGTLGPGSGKLGVFYNWCVTSGGTICGGNHIASEDTPYDICPAGWQLPRGYGEDDSDYGILYRAMSRKDHDFRTALSIPLKYLASDYYKEGWFWTARLNGNSEAWIVMIQDPQDGHGDQGRTHFYEDKDFNCAESIRCLLKN